MFLAGLLTSNHHTGIIILGPVAIAWWLTKSYPLKLRTILTGIALVVAGSLVNSYLIIRGSHGHFFTAVNVDNLTDLWEVISRGAYGSSGTIAVAKNLFHGFGLYWYPLKNLFSILTTNFSYFSYLFFLAGSVWLFRKNLKLFIFIILCLILYGPLLAKITLGSEKKTETDFYIVAHQYFIPALSFFAVVLGAGFYQLERGLKAAQLRLLSKLLPVIFALFPLVFLVSRAADSNYRTNFVPYQVTKDTFSILPSDSVIMTFGDNASYQGWYLKLIGRYREDVCQMSSADQEKIAWMLQGCSRKIYASVFPTFFSEKFTEIVPMIQKHRFYGTDPVKETGAYKKYLYSSGLSIDYLYSPQDVFIKDKKERRRDSGSYFRQRQLEADKLIDYSACFSHFTDDFFSRQLCAHYAMHLTNMARLYSDASYHSTGEKVKVQVNDAKSGYSQPLYTINVTKKNRPYLECSDHLLRFNQWPILYLREKE